MLVFNCRGRDFILVILIVYDPCFAKALGSQTPCARHVLCCVKRRLCESGKKLDPALDPKLAIHS